ncbi:MAG: ArsR family transcriptional regulator [Oscillospiraceae bacterium]|nr:ArsR family transcriptional regulator [Oscillospiraceae bacterium]
MAKILELSLDDAESLSLVGKALSSPTRVEIIRLLDTYSYNIAEIAEKLQIPASTAAVHIRALETANLINTEVQPGERGSMKLCSRKNDILSIQLLGTPGIINEVRSIGMPVGAYTDCNISPTCGVATENEIIFHEDSAMSFYLPERIGAQIIWSSSGYVEYKFPNEAYMRSKKPKQLTLSVEICSEAPNYREDWKSDITLWINSTKSATWTCPGDFGARRGRLNPSWWPDGSSQHGLLTTWVISENGTEINGQKASPTTLGDIAFDAPSITVRIGNAESAQYVGGFNIFGAKFGDYAQDIILSLEY